MTAQTSTPSPRPALRTWGKRSSFQAIRTFARTWLGQPHHKKMAPQIFFRTKEQHAAVTERLQIMKDDFAECEYSAEALEGKGKTVMNL